MTKGGDCYDGNASAKPGQTGWFTVHRGDNSFDYDCSGKADVQWGGTGKCNGFLFVCGSSVAGWDGAVAGCGVTAKWIKGCSGFLCDGKDTENRTQSCH